MVGASGSWFWQSACTMVPSLCGGEGHTDIRAPQFSSWPSLFSSVWKVPLSLLHGSALSLTSLDLCQSMFPSHTLSP